MAFAEPIIVVLGPWRHALSKSKFARLTSRAQCVRGGVHLKEMQPNAEST
jgi:hypothetical protein